MFKNLMAELIRSGCKPDQMARKLAEVLNCTEKTARNKLNGNTVFTMPEALKINTVLFNDRFDLRYLFSITSIE